MYVIFKNNRRMPIRLLPFIISIILLCGLVNTAYAAPTTAVHVVKYAADGTTILNETTVTYLWMEANLPVQGDGKTHYYHQGPVFVKDKEGQWDVNETTNFKDEGAVKGTDVKDLCNLVGGMNAGDEVMIKAIDGYHVEFGTGMSTSHNPGRVLSSSAGITGKRPLSVNGRV